MDLPTALTELLRSSVKVGHRFVKHVNITPRTKPQKRMSMMIYHNLVQKGDSVLELVDSEKVVGMEVIARSAFENYIDLINLFKHRPQYLQYVLYMSSVQQVRWIEGLLKNRQSPFSVSTINSMPERLGITIEQSLEMNREDQMQYRSRLSRVYTDGNKPISEPRSRVNTSVKLRSELAGQLDQYESMYRMLSRSTHSDFMGMLNGVVKGWEFVWPPEPPRPSLLVIDTVTMMIHETSEILVKKLRKPFPAIKRLVDDRHRLHSTRR